MEFPPCVQGKDQEVGWLRDPRDVPSLRTGKGLPAVPVLPDLSEFLLWAQGRERDPQNKVSHYANSFPAAGRGLSLAFDGGTQGIPSLRAEGAGFIGK